ncbi:hypothetical protein [Flavobacterium psychrolimnae]|uniref:Uncharacterized protein n=1 Tax=Flavobacterium psychrolimnae TaxID=249351 RepID=A0A366B2P6_9FLAO|nr:hypothetical protein [Flavobacterium psychrolimnae]RBN51389.1 hypothetical protein DR980_02915 [Flavobacterium psychrolimnae]
MENDKIKLNELIENPEQYFLLLKPSLETRDDNYIIELKVEGYRDLFCILSDLLQTTRLALDGIELSTGSIVNIERYIGSLLRIIEMLIPLEEAELLDILHRKYLNENNKNASN